MCSAYNTNQSKLYGNLCLCSFLELDEGETVESVTQHDIASAVDVASAQKVSFSPHSKIFNPTLTAIVAGPLCLHKIP